MKCNDYKISKLILGVTCEQVLKKMWEMSYCYQAIAAL